MNSGRVIFDVSTLARAGGQAVGIVRVSRELARWAHRHRPDVIFAINDTRLDAFRAVRPEWLGPILDTSAIVDVSVLPEGRRTRQREGARVPGLVRSLLFWFQHPRRRAIVLLERIRLAAPRGVAELAERLSGRLLSPRYRRELTDAQGRRRTLIPYDMAVSVPIVLRPGDTLVFTGSEWGNPNFDALLEAKERDGFSVAALVHDIIPLLFPQFYEEFNLNAFRHYYENMMRLSDLIVFTSRCGQRDSEAYCDAKGIRLAGRAIVPLGADPIAMDMSKPLQLPDELRPGGYALFVSTVEPRKNHAMLLSVWNRLWAAGVPQANDFKLVLVGRRGWLVDDLYAELETAARERRGLLLLSNVNDQQLGDLYRGSAFGIYTSLYEGYGLPLVEMFRLGKTVVSSNGGALAEVAGRFAPSLDPKDSDAWFALLKRWIEDPSARASYEAAVREFNHPGWAEAARQFFGAIDRAPDRAAASGAGGQRAPDS